MSKYDMGKSNRELEEYMDSLSGKKTSEPKSAYDDFLSSYSVPAEPRRMPEERKREPAARQRQGRQPSAVKAEKEHISKRSALEKRAENHCFMIASGIMAIIILAFSVLTVALKDKEYSAEENRTLAQKPALTLSTLTDGTFMDDTEKYLSDQIIGRNSFINAKTAIDVFLGKREENNIYIGKNHYLIEKPTAYDEADVNEKAKLIDNFSKANAGAQSYIMIVPNAAYILGDKLPAGVKPENQKKQIETIYGKLKNTNTVNVTNAMEADESRDDFYYKTDHHWTTQGAFAAFQVLSKHMGIDTSKTKFVTQAVSTSFSGTLASSSGVRNAKDAIYITYPEKDTEYLVNYVRENVKKATAFDESKLNEKNQYEVFFGGNYSQINIRTMHLKTAKKLLVIKDSYANCMLPMMIPYFKEIVIIDPRYYSGDLDKLMKTGGFTDILWLYNCNTFLGDTTITKVFGE